MNVRGGTYELYRKKNGPKKSEIVSKLGPSYFGISLQELKTEVDYYLEDEARGEVDPVYVDGYGRFYLIFKAPGGRTQKFYLIEHGYEIGGKLDEIQHKRRD